MKKYTLEDVKKIVKERDSWWTVLVIDPFATRATLFLANNTRVSPNVITAVSLLLSVLSSFLFFKGLLWQGALIYELSFLFDCIDGKLAQLTGRSSLKGIWLDMFADKVRLILNTLALALYSGKAMLALLFVSLYLWQQIEGLFYLSTGSVGEKRYEDVMEGKRLICKIREYFRRKRLILLPDLVEQDTFAFFIGPLLKDINLGFLVAILLNLLKRTVNFYKFFIAGNAGDN